MKLQRLSRQLENTTSVAYLRYNITGCQFNLENCSEQDFDIFESNLLGRCYIFNKNSTRYQTRPGLLYGLRLQVFVNQDEYLTSPWSEGDTGFSMDITSPYTHFLDANDAILLEPGKRNRLSLKKVGTKRLKEPFHDNCSDGEGISQKILHPGEYSTSLCLLSCFTLEQHKLRKFIDHSFNPVCQVG